MTLLKEKKGEDIKVVYLQEVNSYLEYSVIVTANSDTHVQALGRELSKLLKSINENKYNSREQYKENWLLLDYIDIVIHIFTEEAREFYNLDNLWADGKDLSSKYIS